MKKISLALIAMALSLTTYGQETKTLLGGTGTNNTFGFSITGLSQFTQVAGNSALMGGAKAGLIINDKLSVGGYYLQNLNEITGPTEFPNTYYDLKMGGAFVEYSLWSDRLVHLTIPLFIGGGELSLDDRGDDDLYDWDSSYGDDYFFVIEPGIQAELNVHKYVRFHLGAGYRIVNGIDYQVTTGLAGATNNLDLGNNDISGFTISAGLEIGLFRIQN